MQEQSWFYCFPEKLLMDTMHLSAHDFGAYCRALLYYYVTGPLPDDDATLRKVMGVEPTEWARCKGMVMPFFSQNGDGKWHQKRADIEIIRRNKAIDNNFRRAETARKGKLNLAGSHIGSDADNLSTAREITLRGEYDRLLVELDTLRARYHPTQTWLAKDTERRSKLIGRREELRKLLGITV